MKKRKTKLFQKWKKRIFLTIFLSFFLLFLIMILLNSYLFVIQKQERLSKKKEFKNFKITYIKENRCQRKEKIKRESITYYFECLDMVYVTYGLTKITFEEAIQKDYLNLPLLLENTTLIGKEGDASIYEKKNRKEGDEYRIKILEGEETIVTILPKEKDSTS